MEFVLLLKFVAIISMSFLFLIKIEERGESVEGEEAFVVFDVRYIKENPPSRFSILNCFIIVSSK